MRNRFLASLGWALLFLFIVANCRDATANATAPQEPGMAGGKVASAAASAASNGPEITGWAIVENSLTTQVYWINTPDGSQDQCYLQALGLGGSGVDCSGSSREVVVEARCPAGTKVLSGGSKRAILEWQFGYNQVAQVGYPPRTSSYSMPSSDGRGWRVSWLQNGYDVTKERLITYAVCANVRE